MFVYRLTVMCSEILCLFQRYLVVVFLQFFCVENIVLKCDDP